MYLLDKHITILNLRVISLLNSHNCSSLLLRTSLLYGSPMCDLTNLHSIVGILWTGKQGSNLYFYLNTLIKSPLVWGVLPVTLFPVLFCV